MRYETRLLIPALAVALLFAAFPIGADIGPIDMLKGGGAAAPKAPHQTIRLDSQEVIIRLGGSGYTVDAVFYFYNTGATITEWTGFPKQVEYRGSAHPASTFMRFDGWVDGRQVNFHEVRDPSLPFRLRMSRASSTSERLRSSYGEGRRFIDLGALVGPIKKYRGWFAHEVTFPAHATTKIRVVYEAPYSECGFGCIRASYIYGTGALWKGPIGKAVFIVDSTDIGGPQYLSTQFVTTISPRSISENVTRHERRDFEPYPEQEFVITVKRPVFKRKTINLPWGISR